MKTVSIFLTNQSNKLCKYSNTIRPGKEEVDVDKIVETLKELKKEGFQKVIFTGGEPFLLGHSFIDLIISSKKLGYYTSVTTNGSLITDDIINKVRAYLDEVNLKIDSISGITNILIGNFISEIDSIDYYNLIYKLKKNNLSINIHTVITKFNQFEEMHNIVNFCTPGYWLIQEVEKEFCVDYNSIKPDNNNYLLFISKHAYSFIVDKETIELSLKF